MNDYQAEALVEAQRLTGRALVRIAEILDDYLDLVLTATATHPDLSAEHAAADLTPITDVVARIRTRRNLRNDL